MWASSGWRVDEVRHALACCSSSPPPPLAARPSRCLRHPDAVDPLTVQGPGSRVQGPPSPPPRRRLRHGFTASGFHSPPGGAGGAGVDWGGGARRGGARRGGGRGCKTERRYEGEAAREAVGAAALAALSPVTRTTQAHVRHCSSHEDARCGAGSCEGPACPLAARGKWG